MAELGIEDIMGILPHRYPFLMVDRIIECDDQQRIVGLKNVSVDEWFFQGHFPEMPVMPGVLQLEAMAQTGGILLVRAAGLANAGIPFFMSIDKVKFRKVVKPGDQMRIEVDIIKMRSKSAKFQAKIFVDETVVSEAELMCMFTGEGGE